MSAADTMTGYGRELRDICGAEFVVDDPAQLKRYSLLGVIPAMAVTPARRTKLRPSCVLPISIRCAFSPPVASPSRRWEIRRGRWTSCY